MRNLLFNICLSLFAFFLTFLFGTELRAQQDTSVGFDRPVKLDKSGRPVYNSWERQEQQRRQRVNQGGGSRYNIKVNPNSTNTQQVKSDKDQNNQVVGSNQGKSATKAAGSSAINPNQKIYTNSPVQINPHGN